MYIASALGIILLIFYFSSQPYHKQDLKPVLDGVVNIEGLEERLSDYSFSYAGGEVSVEGKGVAGFLEFFIRKGAHFAIFFCLGWFVMAALGLFVKKAMFSAALSALIVTAYAVSDEIHQHFTGNRTPLLEDVLLDTAGGIAGILSLWLYRKRKSRLRRERRKPNSTGMQAAVPSML